MAINLLGDGAVVLRANLHGHSTESDGRLSPQEYVRWYARRGYDALAISDHNRRTDPAGLDAEGMLLLPAAEITAAGAEFGGHYHLVALGPLPDPLPAVSTPAPESARLLRAAGAVVVVAHPHWSGLTAAELLAVEAADGLEIWNGGTVLDSEKGVALADWDQLLRRGRRPWGFATDDAHFRLPDGATGWVVLRARERSAEAALEALRRGHFYSSAGPELLAVQVEGGVVRVSCSPCQGIYCLGFAGRNQYRRGTPDQPLTSAEFTLRSDDPWVRVQVTDAAGRSAWSQPYWPA